MPRVKGLLAIIAVAWIAPVAAQQPAMSPAEFAAELRRLSDEVSSGDAGVVPSVKLPGVWAVEEDGDRYEVPVTWLQTTLIDARRNPGTWPSERAKVLAQLHALQIEAEALSTRSSSARPPTSATARTALSEVLARPEFRRMAQESAFARLRQRVTQWLVRVWDRLGGDRLGSRNTAILFAWISVLLAAGALATWVVRLLRQPERRRLPLAPAHAQKTPAVAWARQALAAADPRDAIRCAYRAVVSGLEEEGAWRVDDTRTPREYLGILPKDHRQRPLVADVTRRFEEIWFGARRATADDRDAALASLKEMGWLPAAE